MNIGAIVNPGDAGGIQTAISGSRLTMDASPTSQGRRTAKLRSEGEPGRNSGYHNPSPIKPSKRNAKRKAGKPTHARGGAKSFTLHNDPSSQLEVLSSRHIRHRQPPHRPNRADDRPRTPRQAARHDECASLPLPSPAKDLLRRARETVAVDTDWLGRRPFVMDVILGNRPSASQYSEDAVMDAIELSATALGPARSVYHLADMRSLDLYWEAQTAHTRLAAGFNSQQMPVPEFQISAERSTVTWLGDEAPVSPPSNNDDSSPSVGTPQHMNVNVQGAVAAEDQHGGDIVRGSY